MLSAAVNILPGQKAQDKDFVENIGPNDPRYPANKLTAFRIYLTNTSNGTLKDIVVKDIFPPRFLTYVSGPGSYDNTTRTFSSTIKELKAKQTTNITIQVLTADLDELPTNNSSLCTINLAIATANNKVSQDNSQICVSREQTATNQIPNKQSTSAFLNPATSKGGLPVESPAQVNPGQQTPSTGPGLLGIIALLPATAVGWMLRRKSSQA
ncbi:MAG: hypothetical protein HZC02_02845 [Candidatus Levybacteria bacterium]|nr:hypothetical protein [Candidatus Levybacteria bacterium]